MRLAACIVALTVGCSSGSDDRSPRPVAVVAVKPRVGVERAPTPAPSAVEPAAKLPEATPRDRCVDAFEAQVMVFPDETPTSIHPNRRSNFLALCAQLSDALRACVSPFHAMKHQAECQDARAQASEIDQFRLSALYTIIVPDVDLSTPWGDAPP